MNHDTFPVRLRCRCCGEAFSAANVFSLAGYVESQVTGICETCYDLWADLPRPQSAPPDDRGDEQA